MAVEEAFQALSPCTLGPGIFMQEIHKDCQCASESEYWLSMVWCGVMSQHHHRHPMFPKFARMIDQKWVAVVWFRVRQKDQREYFFTFAIASDSQQEETQQHNTYPSAGNLDFVSQEFNEFVIA